MDERNIRDAIEEFRVSPAVKEAGLSRARVEEYIRQALDQALQQTIQILPEEQAQTFLQNYYINAVQTIANLQAYKGILREKIGGVTKPLD